MKQGSIAEAVMIMDLLRETDPNVYVAEHISLPYCYCEDLSSRFTSVPAYVNILSQLWQHVKHSPNKALLPELAVTVMEYMSKSEAEGRRTLMQGIASCHHPQ